MVMSDVNQVELSAADRDYVAACKFLFHEAELLDQNRLDDWLACLAPDLRYFMPVRATVLRKDLADSVSQDIGHFDDNFESMFFRVKRTQLPSAFAEDPPSRTRRFVTNIQLRDEVGGADELAVSSYLLVMRSRWDDPNFEIISAERRDVLVRTDDGLKLRSREIITDQVTLGTVNLGIYL